MKNLLVSFNLHFILVSFQCTCVNVCASYLTIDVHVVPYS